MRVENWNIEFIQALAEAQKTVGGFGWAHPSSSGAGIGLASQAHCLGFASYMVEAITGRNYWAELAGEPEESALGAMKKIRALGFDSLDQLIGSIFQEKPLPFIQRGDLVMLDSDTFREIPQDTLDPGLRLLVGVADPPFVWVVAPHGIDKVAMRAAVKGYGVD